MTNPRWTQYFLYTKENEIRLALTDDCWDIVEGDPAKELLLIKLYACHKQKGRQEYFFDEVRELAYIFIFDRNSN